VGEAACVMMMLCAATTTYRIASHGLGKVRQALGGVVLLQVVYDAKEEQLAVAGTILGASRLKRRQLLAPRREGQSANTRNLAW